MADDDINNTANIVPKGGRGCVRAAVFIYKVYILYGTTEYRYYLHRL